MSKKFFLVLVPLLFISGLILGLMWSGNYPTSTHSKDNPGADALRESDDQAKSSDSSLSPSIENDSLNDGLAGNEPGNSSELSSLLSGTAKVEPSAQADVSYDSEEQVNITVYEQRNKAVVNITREILAYNWFLEPVPKESGVGSGTVIDKIQPYILTNYHVIRNANSIYITTHTNDKYEGHLVGYDIENDLALLTIRTDKALDLGEVPIASPNLDLKVGQKVLAIGNPFGLERTLTTGIISALGRSVKNENLVIRNMIQTDASINPGNSGSPLLNDQGQLIGINTAILSPSQGSVGLGFAVTHKTIERVLIDLIKYGKVNRGWIRMKFQPLFNELVDFANLPVDKGLLVTTIQEGSALQKAGLRAPQTKTVRYGRTIIPLGGDIITAINDVEVWNLPSLLEALEYSRPDQSVSLSYYRGDKLKQTSILLEERPDGLLN